MSPRTNWIYFLYIFYEILIKVLRLMNQLFNLHFYFLLFHSDHDKCYITHPVKMGPQESGDPHPNRGEAAGTFGLTGKT